MREFEVLQRVKHENIVKLLAIEEEQQESRGKVIVMELCTGGSLFNILDDPKAKQQLQWAQTHTKDDNLLPAINLRLARVQLQEKQFDDALKTLDAVQKGGWFAQAQAIRGDVLVAKGDTKGARDAYTQAFEDNPSPVLKELLRIKLNNLAA